MQKIGGLVGWYCTFLRLVFFVPFLNGILQKFTHFSPWVNRKAIMKQSLAMTPALAAATPGLTESALQR